MSIMDSSTAGNDYVRILEWMIERGLENPWSNKNLLEWAVAEELVCRSVAPGGAGEPDDAGFE
jgi:hypothetical protein